MNSRLIPACSNASRLYVSQKWPRSSAKRRGTTSSTPSRGVLSTDGTFILRKHPSSFIPREFTHNVGQSCAPVRLRNAIPLGHSRAVKHRVERAPGGSPIILGRYLHELRACSTNGKNRLRETKPRGWFAACEMEC